MFSRRYINALHFVYYCSRFIYLGEEKIVKNEPIEALQSTIENCSARRSPIFISSLINSIIVFDVHWNLFVFAKLFFFSLLDLWTCETFFARTNKLLLKHYQQVNGNMFEKSIWGKFSADLWEEFSNRRSINVVRFSLFQMSEQYFDV